MSTKWSLFNQINLIMNNKNKIWLKYQAAIFCWTTSYGIYLCALISSAKWRLRYDLVKWLRSCHTNPKTCINASKFCIILWVKLWNNLIVKTYILCKCSWQTQYEHITIISINVTQICASWMPWTEVHIFKHRSLLFIYFIHLFVR